MDVRCEKCQTEYELDEARLKPGGVTVKCTNCGHMFKIRKRSTTNVGLPVVDPARASATPPTGSPQPGLPRVDSILGDSTAGRPATGDDPADAKHWLIRLENGEQKSCRELATLQQWIVACVVTRESLISRTGKTWKRLGDIAELGQYFTIADEARSKRQAMPTGKTGKDAQSTMLGIGGASATGGTILPDDDERATGNFRSRTPTPPPPAPGKPTAKTPPLGSGTSGTSATSATDLAVTTRRPATQPPPPPKKQHSQAGPLPSPDRGATPSVPAGNRATAAWATTNDGVAPSGAPTTGPIGPRGGRISANTDEPAFAGRVRVEPSDDAAFTSGRTRPADDDDDMLPGRTGSRGGMWILLMALLVMAAAAGVVYVFVIKKDKAPEQAVKPTVDAAVVATAPADAAVPVITPVLDAAPVPAATPLDIARGELAGDDETRLRDALKALETVPDADAPPALALRANLAAAVAQGMIDRAAITADKADATKLKKDADAIVNDAATWAQKAQKAQPDDPVANLAMAEILRLRGKPAKDIKRYLDAAKAKAGADWTRDVALADALVLARDGKLEDAKAALAAIDKDDGVLEKSGDVRARFHLALIAYAQNKPAEAKPLAEAVMAAQAQHAASKALLARIETTVAKTDPLPPEDGGSPKDAGAGSAKPPTTGGPQVPSGGESYDKLLARANALAESNCSKALELFGKALEQKPNGVEALTGMGYCHIDAKQFASAFSKFRAALAVSPRYEPALWGVGEAYQQQGRKEQAIEAFRAYLDAYPGSAKAQKQLDRLVGDQPKPPDTSGGSGSTSPTPTPTPTPDGAGSGSG